MTQPAPAPGHVLHQLARSVDRRRLEARRRREIRHLRDLPPEILSDIGVTPEDIHDALSAPLSDNAVRIFADRRRARRF